MSRPPALERALALAAWRRLPTQERLDLLEYLRQEAAAAGTICSPGDPFAKMWKRSNLALVRLVVAIADEPRPREKSKPARKKTRR